MSALESAQALTKMLNFNDDVLTVSLTDMTDDIARRQLRDGGPSVAWNIGHMLRLRNEIAKAIGCREPAVDVKPFAESATDGRGYPTLRELQAAWKEFSGRLIPALDRLSAADLEKPSPISLPHGERTLLDTVRFVLWHETLHLGQVAMLRSHHGLVPTVTLLQERAAVA